MNGQPDPARARALAKVTGPAIFGESPAQILCWKPCCNGSVRLGPDDFAMSWLPVVVRCEAPRCQCLWTVTFPKTPVGKERVAVWRLVSQDQPIGRTGQGRGDERARDRRLGQA
ncbi:MAG: hypothetical protein ACRDYA_15250 [Egibacteraceae bacterium]